MAYIGNFRMITISGLPGSCGTLGIVHRSLGQLHESWTDQLLLRCPSARGSVR